MQGDYASARSFYEAALTLGRKLENRNVIAGSLGNLGTVATLQSDYAVARSCFEESLAIKRELGDRRDISNTLVGLGTVAMEQGDYESARLLGKESLALGRELEDKERIARSLINLANVAMLQSDYATARLLFEESLAIKRELGDKRGIANVLNGLGNVAKEQGSHGVARSLYEESGAAKRIRRQGRVVRLAVQPGVFAGQAGGLFCRAGVSERVSWHLSRIRQKTHDSLRPGRLCGTGVPAAADGAGCPLLRSGKRFAQNYRRFAAAQRASGAGALCGCVAGSGRGGHIFGGMGRRTSHDAGTGNGLRIIRMQRRVRPSLNCRSPTRQ